MKNKRILICLIAFALIVTLTAPITSATAILDNGTNDTEEQKVYSKATIHDDFSDSRVMVVMKNSVSMELKEYGIEDFSEINAKNIVDLASATRSKATAQLEKLNAAFFNRTPVDSENFVSYKNYHQIVCIELEEKGKDKVLEAIDTLQKREDIICVEPDYPIYLNSSGEDTYDGTHDREDKARYDDLIQLPEAWEAYTGTSTVVVGVIDSGIDGSHPDLIDKIDVSLSLDLTNRTYEDVSAVTDPRGHGTLVAGIIGATITESRSIQGVCENVTLVSLRVFNDNGVAYSYNLGLAVNAAEHEDIPILNFSGSWSHSGNWHTFDSNSALHTMISNYSGLFICTAGNVNRNNDTNEVYPANWKLPNLIAVGSSNLSDERELGTAYGVENVDLFAPGEDIYSTYPEPFDYAVGTGTSMAAPYVTGVAALMLSTNPNLEPHEIKCIIMRNVDDCGTKFDNECVSGGRLNAYKALTGTVNHSFSHVNDSEDGNIIVCEYCKYECKTPRYLNMGVTQGHRVSCLTCGYNYLESHTWTYSLGIYRCIYCNCTTNIVPGIMSFNDEEQKE